MAKHFDSIETAGVPLVSKDEFYRNLRSGDMVVCCGQSLIAKEIGHCSGSLLSHILAVHLPEANGPWATLESTFTKGVHVGLLSDYTDGQDGPIVLVRRPAMSGVQIAAFLGNCYALVDDRYDWEQEVSVVAHRLLSRLPVVRPKKELFCSGLMYTGALDVDPFAYQINAQHPNLPTPEDLYTDPSVVAICALVHP